MILFPDQSPEPARVDRARFSADYSFSRVINGCWQLAAGHGGNALDESALMSRFAALVDAGFATFDCADIYTGVEALLGRFIQSYPARDKIQVHTKFVPDLPLLAQLDRNMIEAGIDRSLKRLGVERLDLVQFHWWDYKIPGYLDALQVLGSLQEQGKIRHIGLTNFNQEHVQEMLDAGFVIASLQLQYSLLDRRAQNGMSRLCQQHGISMLAYGALAGGLLSQAFLGAQSAGENNRSLVKYRLIVDEAGGWESFQALLSVLEGIARNHGVSIASIASHWVLDQPGVEAVILGTGSRNRIEENQQMLKLRLSSAEQSSITTVLGKMQSPPGDVFDLERQPQGRHAKIMKTSLNSSLNPAP